ncbi:MAG: MinD/ParA family protein [Candidatus Aquicultor sp.]
MNDQAKKLRELAQKIREERERANLIIDPLASTPEKPSVESSIIPGGKGPVTVIAAAQPEPIPVEPEPLPPIPIQPAEVQPLPTQPAPPKPAPKIMVEPSPALPSAASTFTTRVIAISSGKGGVGKSNLVANLGIALAMRGKKVMLLDADLGLANIDVLFGINPKYNLKNLVDGDKTMQEILVTGPHSIKIVPGGSGIPELANLSDAQQEKLLESFVLLEREADITLIDTGAGISKDIISFILAAREALIITTPEPTAITDAYGLIKVLTQRDPNVDIKIVVNMVSSEKEGQEIAGRIVMATRQFLNKRIEPVGYIVSDPSVNMSVRKQEPFILGYPGARASKCIKQIAASLDQVSTDDMQIVGRNGLRGFLSRLFER